MAKKIYLTWIIIPMIVILGGACSFLGSGEAQTSAAQPTQPEQQATPTSAIAAQEGGGGGEQSIDTEFPLPDDAQGLMHLDSGDEAINFQTKMTLEEAIAFYREAFEAKGLSEETILTTIDEKGFSIVFKGSANGKALVVQSVDLGNGTINLNIRYEEL